MIFSKNQLLVSLIFWYWFLVFNFTDFCSHCFSSYAYFGFTLLFFRLLIFGLYSFLIYALKWYKSPFLFLSLTNFGKLHFHSAQNILIFLLRFLLWCMYLSSMYFGISSLILCGLKADILWFLFLSLDVFLWPRIWSVLVNSTGLWEECVFCCYWVSVHVNFTQLSDGALKFSRVCTKFLSPASVHFWWLKSPPMTVHPFDSLSIPRVLLQAVALSLKVH